MAYKLGLTTTLVENPLGYTKLDDSPDKLIGVATQLKLALY
jgi:hypothetical protein